MIKTIKEFNDLFSFKKYLKDQLDQIDRFLPLGQMDQMDLMDLYFKLNMFKIIKEFDD